MGLKRCHMKLFLTLLVCAWVVWAKDSKLNTWSRINAWESRSDCQAELDRMATLFEPRPGQKFPMVSADLPGYLTVVHNPSGTLSEYKCYSDTIEPRR